MIDFHSHILPHMDDGPQHVSESLSMLRQSFWQGVDVMVATSHFYADEESPQEFLKRRNAAFRQLQDEMLMQAEVYPLIVLGAEVLYFPGISQAEDVEELTIGSSGVILVEPPMARWSDQMLDEIVQLGENFGCKPAIAHVNRYMTYLRDKRLMDRVLERGLMVQVNAGWFLNPKTEKTALRHLKNGNIHLIGSDCHNLDSRAPNLGYVRKWAQEHGAEEEFDLLRRNAQGLLFHGRRQ